MSRRPFYHAALARNHPGTSTSTLPAMMSAPPSTSLAVNLSMPSMTENAAANTASSR